MDINGYFERYSAEEMLAALPRNYTRAMALYNNDIVDDQLEDYWHFTFYALYLSLYLTELYNYNYY